LTQLASPPFAQIVLIDRQPKFLLFHRILLTFHDTCDTRDIDVAVRLLKILEAMATVSGDVASRERTRERRGFMAASERLWNIRYSASGSTHPLRQ
jgi:hypothetical protein